MAQIGTGLVVMAIGVALHWPVFAYHGAPLQPSFNSYVFDKSWAAYTDVASLYFRDGLSHHPVPYFDYRLEYPVVTGFFTYVLSFAPGGSKGYFLATALVLAGCGIAAIALVRRIAGSNP